VKLVEHRFKEHVKQGCSRCMHEEVKS